VSPSRIPADPSRIVPTAVLVLVLIGGCGRGRPDTGHSFEVVDEEGMPTAVTRGGPRYDEELFDYVPVLTLREDEREESLLFNPAGFHRDERGWYFVNDLGNDRIAVFDPYGRYDHAISRSGSGPGEFQTARIEEVREGVVTTYDLTNRQLCRFTVEGRLLDTRRQVDDQVAAMMVGGARYREGGGILLQVADVDPTDPSSMERFALRTLLTGPDGDTLWTVRTPEVKVMDYVTVEIRGMALPMPAPLPLTASPVVEFLTDGGILVSGGHEPLQEVYDGEGRLTRRIRVELTPERTTDRDRQAILDDIQASIDAAEDDLLRDLFKAQQEHVRLPEYKAFWGGVQADEAGWFWLSHPTPNMLADLPDTTAVYRVLSPEGEYLGDTTVPKGSYRRITHGHLLHQREDPESGEVTLEVLAIRPRIPGLVYP